MLVCFFITASLRLLCLHSQQQDLLRYLTYQNLQSVAKLYNREDFGVDFLTTTFTLHLAFLFFMDPKIFLTDNLDGSRSLRRFICLAILEYLSRSVWLRDVASVKTCGQNKEISCHLSFWNSIGPENPSCVCARIQLVPNISCLLVQFRTRDDCISTMVTYALRELRICSSLHVTSHLRETSVKPCQYDVIFYLT